MRYMMVRISAMVTLFFGTRNKSPINIWSEAKGKIQALTRHIFRKDFRHLARSIQYLKPYRV